MTNKKINRRQFLRGGCLTVVAAGLTVSGIGAVIPDPEPAELNSTHFGDKSMRNKILIAYGSYAGSTADVARVIGESLGQQGFAVDVRPIQDKPQIDGYRAVLVGSAVQYARWLPDSIDFVKRNREGLNRVPVALFCVHIQNLGDDQTSHQNRLAYLDDVRPLLQPFAEGYFAGKFDRRGAYLLLPKLLARFTPPIDLRKWDKIRAWSQSTGRQLKVELQAAESERLLVIDQAPLTS